MYQKPAWSTWLSKTIRLPNLFGEYARYSRLLWFPGSIRSAFSLHQTGGRPTDDGALVETTASLCHKDRTRNSLVLSSYRRSHFLKSLTTESAWEKRLKRGVKALPTKRKFNPTEKRSKRDYLKDFDTFGTWDNRIEKLPILVEESIKKGKLIPEISIDLVGTASLQGRCKYQEDRFVVMELEKGMLYFGVFDGHRGDSASEYMKERLHHHVLHHLKNDEGKDLEAVLSKAFISVNNAFAKYAAAVPSDEAHEAGTTATVALLRNSVQLVVAHVGDSRALIYRKGEVTVLTKDHDPEDRVERERVLKENGVIVWTSLGRALVNGRLAMTRSLGDLDLKAYGVSATPDTSTMAIKHGKDAFLALISDGISFVMSNQEIGNCIATCEDAQEAAQALCDQMMAGLKMEVLSRSAHRTLLANHPFPDRLRTLPALSHARYYFDKTAAKKEQRSQELKTISAKDHHEWGYNLLALPQFNKGMGFTIDERQRLRIHGLLPPRVMDADTQRDRTLAKAKSLPTQLDRFTFMMALRDRNEKLFYRTIAENISYFLPVIYTPTVGQACMEYGFHFTRPRGIFISIYDRGHIRSILENWPFVNVKAIVVTDGERILGLGDLGAYGMGIPVGKLALYTALAGIQPSECLPITIDVGTNSEKILDDPYYIGIPQQRTRGPAYDDLIDEFMEACVATFGQNVLIQFEDFAYQNAYRLIQKYQYKYNTFNDDIMGTASVAVAGIFAALRVSGKPLKDNLFLFQGAGSANLGIARLLKSALVDEGLSEEEAHQRIWMFDIGGLLVHHRPTGGLDGQTLPFAHDYKHLDTLEAAVKDLNPSVIVGASTVRGAFTPAILQHMAATHDRPVVFALSNPTSRAECTALEAYTHTQGRCVFCSGSPFEPVEFEGKRFEPGQGNNAYIFPGVSLAAILGQFKHIPDRYFLIASKVLADLVSEDDLELGRVYPRLDDIREISKTIAVRLIEQAYEDNLATLYPRPADLTNFITYRQYDFGYNNFLPETWPWPDVTY